MSNGESGSGPRTVCRTGTRASFQRASSSGLKMCICQSAKEEQKEKFKKNCLQGFLTGFLDQ